MGTGISLDPCITLRPSNSRVTLDSRVALDSGITLSSRISLDAGITLDARVTLSPSGACATADEIDLSQILVWSARARAHYPRLRSVGIVVRRLVDDRSYKLHLRRGQAGHNDAVDFGYRCASSGGNRGVLVLTHDHAKPAGRVIEHEDMG